MLRRVEGATIAQIVEATGWQPHTARGALAGALKKRLGLDVASGEGRGARAGVSHRRLIFTPYCSKPGDQMVARLSHSRWQQVRSDDGTPPRIVSRRLVRTISGA